MSKWGTLLKGFAKSTASNTGKFVGAGGRTLSNSVIHPAQAP